MVDLVKQQPKDSNKQDHQLEAALVRHSDTGADLQTPDTHHTDVMLLLCCACLCWEQCVYNKRKQTGITWTPSVVHAETTEGACRNDKELGVQVACIPAAHAAP